MDLRQFQYVIAVAEELSFTRAAVRLHITQPPLTQQIRTVESELGFRLFHRTKRVVQVTQAGKVFVDRARQILHDVADLRNVAHLASRGEAGRIAIGFIPAIALDFFPHILREYRAVMPLVEIELLEANNRALMDALRKKRIDVAFLRPYFQDADIAMKSILEDRFVAAFPGKHRLASRKSISIRELEDEPFVTVNRSPTPSLYAQIMTLCEEAGFHPRVAQESTNLHTAVGLVSAGMGVAVLPKSIMNVGLDGVSYSELRDVSERIHIVMAWRRDDRNSVLVEFLKKSENVAKPFSKRSRIRADTGKTSILE